MTGIAVTRHGAARLSQRGIRRSDLDILLAHGAETGPHRFMLRRRDAAKVICDLKRQIARLERLAGKEVVVADGRLVTAYHRARPIRPFERRTRRGG